jgi:hypothetical protein
MGRIALATDLRSRDGTLAKDARIVNGYVEREGDKLYVFKRPAITLANETSAGAGIVGLGVFFPPINTSGTLAALDGSSPMYSVVQGATGNATLLSITGSISGTLPASDTNWQRWDGLTSAGAPSLGVNDGSLASCLANYAPILWGSPGSRRLCVTNQDGKYYIAGPSTPDNTEQDIADIDAEITTQDIVVASTTYGPGPDTFSATSLGTMTNTNRATASFAAADTGVVFIKFDATAYTYNGTNLTQVNDAQYPASTVPGVVYLNGIFYVMDRAGTIWGSAEDDPTSWAADNFITAEFEADGGVRLAKMGSNVVALGRYTTEQFFDAGNATGSALSPVQSDPLLIGCANAGSVAQTESFITWVAQQKAQNTDFHRGRFVVVLSGAQYRRISTPDIERILDADDFVAVAADIITSSGHAFYVLTLVASDITLVYDFKEGIWYEWKKGAANTNITISALTQSGGTATATATAHGLSDGDQVTVSGATQAGYNLSVNVTRTGADSFTYPVAAATVSPATGSPVAANWSQGMFDVSSSCNFAGVQVIQFRETGKVYVLDTSSTTDQGSVPIDFQCITEKHDGGNNMQKFMSRLELVGDKVSSTALVRYSDDDYASWSTYRRMDMSLPRVGVNRLGDFHRRAMQIRHTLSAKVRVEALEADVEQGG